MVFESSTGIERNKKIQLAQAIVITLCVLGFYIRAQLHLPEVHIPNGIYQNNCCADILLSDGYLTYGSKTLSIKILTLKYDITGVVDGIFNRKEIQEDKNSTTLFYQKNLGKLSLLLPISGKQTAFTAVKDRSGH